MAIILEGPDGAPVIWGKLGDYVFQRTKTGKLSIRRYKKPSNPGTLAQQSNRLAMREGISRWGDQEKLSNKAYWDKIAGDFGFRDGYRAFLSSYMTLYHLKRKELGDDALALSFVTDRGKPISHLASPLKKARAEGSERLISSVLRYKSGQEYYKLLRDSHLYLKLRGWWNSLPYNILPQADPYLTPKLEGLGLLPSSSAG